MTMQVYNDESVRMPSGQAIHADVSGMEKQSKTNQKTMPDTMKDCYGFLLLSHCVSKGSTISDVATACLTQNSSKIHKWSSSPLNSLSRTEKSSDREVM